MRLPQLIALVSISFEYIQSCCFPSVFEVTKINTIIAEENSTNQEKIYFSAEIGKAAEVRTNEWGQTERKIYDRATKKRYVITDENVCDVTDLYESIQKMCMPPSAVFIGSTVLDNNNLTVNNYYVNTSHGNSFIDINLMTIPIKEGPVSRWLSISSAISPCCAGISTNHPMLSRPLSTMMDLANPSNADLSGT
uniref:Uncharacterized protein n=1 Tax=Magallana gigas TaxID=29159 RepID=K1QXZ0_MAGGI